MQNINLSWSEDLKNRFAVCIDRFNGGDIDLLLSKKLLSIRKRKDLVESILVGSPFLLREALSTL